MKRTRGFTLLEVMVALVVMILASMGVVVGLVAASRELRTGQLRLHKSALLDASAQRLRLQSKATLTRPTGQGGPAISPPGVSPPLQPIGTGNWVKDPTPTVPGDLSTGAFFTMLPNGQFTQLPDGLAASCSPAAMAGLNDNVYCRERMIVQGGPGGPLGAIGPAGSQVATVWFRVSRKSELPTLAVVSAEVVAQ